MLVRLAPVQRRVILLTKKTRRGGRELPGTRAAATLASATRSVDQVWTDGPDLYVLLWDTGPKDAVHFLSRLGHEQPALMADHRVTSASFPLDGLTYGALRSALRALPSLVSECGLDSP